MAAKIKEGMTGGQVADIIEQNFENLENKFQQLSDQFDHTKEDINRTLDEYQSQVDDAYGSIAVQVDEEDTTTDRGKIKFKDRAYEPDKFSGKGYKILRKNIVCNTEAGESKNILTQDMINEPNTVYEIRYDFDLNGETINIPEGCTLKFSEGSLKYGSINFNNNYIKGNDGCFIEIAATGNILNKDFYIDWFTVNNYTSIFQLAGNSNLNNFILGDKTYYLDNHIDFNYNFNIIGSPNGNTIIKIDGDCKVEYDPYQAEGISSVITYKSNIGSVLINNVNFIVDAESKGFVENTNPTGSRDYIFLYIENPEKLIIENCSYLFNTTGEYPAVFIKTYARNLVCKNTSVINKSTSHAGYCVGFNYGTQGNDNSKCVIDNCYFENYAGDETISFFRSISSKHIIHYIDITNTKIIRHVNSGRGSSCINAPLTANEEENEVNTTTLINITNCDFEVIGDKIDDKRCVYIDVRYTDSVNLTSYQGYASVVCNNCSFNGGYGYGWFGVFTTLNEFPIYWNFNNCTINTNNANILITSCQKAIFNNCNINITNLYKSSDDYPRYFIGNLLFNKCDVTGLEYPIFYRFLGNLYINNSKIQQNNDRNLAICYILNRETTITDLQNLNLVINNTTINDLQINDINSANIKYGITNGDNISSIGYTFNKAFPTESKPIKIWSKESFTAFANGKRYTATLESTTNTYEISIYGMFKNAVLPVYLIDSNNVVTVNYILTDRTEVRRIFYSGVSNNFPKDIVDENFIYYNLDTDEFNIWSQNTWKSLDGYNYNIQRTGDTEERPTGVKKGFQYFDTTLNKPIWWTGTKWVDATGADV